MLVALWAFVPPVSTLMAARYLTLRPVDRRWVPLDRMSPKLVAAVLASEDSQFCRHDGVDFTQLKLVIDSAGKAGPARGASTIDMQVAKNLFLAPVHSYLRKGVEILFALAIDRLWGKRRVLEVYLNVAEWGDGVFGTEAAARRHFGRASADLTARQASLLALALPNPYERDPARPRGLYTRLVGLNQRRARDMGPWLDCLPAPKR